MNDTRYMIRTLWVCLSVLHVMGLAACDTVELNSPNRSGTMSIHLGRTITPFGAELGMTVHRLDVPDIQYGIDPNGEQLMPLIELCQPSSSSLEWTLKVAGTERSAGSGTCRTFSGFEAGDEIEVSVGGPFAHANATIHMFTVAEQEGTCVYQDLEFDHLGNMAGPLRCQPRANGGAVTPLFGPREEEAPVQRTGIRYDRENAARETIGQIRIFGRVSATSDGSLMSRVQVMSQPNVVWQQIGDMNYIILQHVEQGSARSNSGGEYALIMLITSDWWERPPTISTVPIRITANAPGGLRDGVPYSYKQYERDETIHLQFANGQLTAEIEVNIEMVEGG